MMLGHHVLQLLCLILLYMKSMTVVFCYDTSCSEVEREALLKLKESLSDPVGRLSSWRGNECCNWEGVSCSNITSHVVSLNLRNSASDALGGNVSSSLVHLQHLSYLDLSANNFEGIPIPNFIGELTNLKYLNLSHASFSGSIPASLGNLSNVQFLDLRMYTEEVVENDLRWISGLSSVEYLDLGELDLAGASAHWLSSINYLTSLKELHLPQCHLVNLCQNNGFSSTLPSWLFNLSRLAQLDLSNNNFHGMLPDAFSKLSSLETLDLSYNLEIETGLSSLGKLCNLKTLKANNNKLTGEIQ